MVAHPAIREPHSGARRPAAHQVLLGAGAASIARLAPAPPARAERVDGGLAAIGDGLRAVAQSDRILPVVIAVAAVGVLFTGAFSVILPLRVRDVHAGSAAELATINVCFWGGTVAATLAQVRLRPLERPGRALIVTLALGAAILAAMGGPIPFAMLAALCAVWGVGAGIVFTQARTIVQIAARDTHRARVLAVFQLGLSGGAPLGAVVLGYVAGAVRPAPRARLSRARDARGARVSGRALAPLEPGGARLTRGVSVGAGPCGILLLEAEPSETSRSTSQ